MQSTHTIIWRIIHCTAKLICHVLNSGSTVSTERAWYQYSRNDQHLLECIEMTRSGQISRKPSVCVGDVT
jgi:hypothetical protein